MSKKPSSRNSMLSALMTSQAAPAAAPEQKTATVETPTLAPRDGDFQPRVSAGAVGALKNTLAHITKEGRVVEIDPAMISPSPFPDRMDGAEDTEAIEALAQSIARSGQEVPVLVRSHPVEPNRYQTIYGHRRVKAIAVLGQGLKVRAVVRELSDGELLIAQGIENSARQDLSWIEKAMFARRLEQFARDSGRDPTAFAMEALSLHAPDVSRFRTTLEAIPDDIVTAIGSAPKVGRTKWLKLYGLVKEDGMALARMRRLKEARGFAGQTSDDRFAEMLKAAASKLGLESVAPEGVLAGSDGQPIGSIDRRRSATKFTLTDRAFADFIEDRISALHAEFLAGRDDRD